MIPKSDLKHGAYYKGVCRNADVARWNAHVGLFIHWRTKFGHSYTEAIHHPDDDKIYDVFRPDTELDAKVVEEIPF